LLLTASVFFSLAVITRRYYITALVGAIIFLSLKNKKLLALYLTLFLILPLTLYFFTFYPWFLRGYSLIDWLAFQKYMVSQEFTGVSPQASGYAALYGHSYRAFDWFIKPVIFGFVFPLSRSFTAVFLVLNNPLSWFLIWPSLIFLIFKRKEEKSLTFLILVFFLLYFPFLIAKRQILIYSSLAVLPWAFLLLAAAIYLFSQATALRKKVAALFLTLVVTSNLLFYPLAIGYTLPNKVVSFLPFKAYLQ